MESKLQLGQVNSQIDVINRSIELITRAERDASNGKNSFSKSDSDEAEFCNKLANIYTKRKEFVVDEEALRSKSATEDQINEYKKVEKIKDDGARYDGIIQFTHESPRIHVNDEVSLMVGGLNQAEYGTVKGKVSNIDEDATIDN